MLRLTSASVSSARNFSGFYRRLLCSVMSCPLRIRLRTSQENDDILPKFPAAVLAELLGRHPPRGQIKDPQIGRLAHAGHGVFRHKIVLLAALGTATGIGLSIYFRFGPFNSVPSEIQFSIFNPGTFEKCEALFVTSVKSFALATAAMNMSSEPIGVPAVSSATLMSA